MDPLGIGAGNIKLQGTHLVSNAVNCELAAELPAMHLLVEECENKVILPPNRFMP